MTISISSDSSYYSTSYIDDGYIAPEIVLGATFVSSTPLINESLLTSVEATSYVSNFTFDNSRLIVDSYFVPEYIDWNYISPDILHAVTSLSNVKSIDTTISLNGIEVSVVTLSATPTTKLDSVESTGLVSSIDSVNVSVNLSPIEAVGYIESVLFSRPISHVDSTGLVSSINSVNITVNLGGVVSSGLVSALYPVLKSETLSFTESYGEVGTFELTSSPPISNSYNQSGYIDWNYTNPDTTPLLGQVSTAQRKDLELSLSGTEATVLTRPITTSVKLYGLETTASLSVNLPTDISIELSNVVASASILAVSPIVEISSVSSEGIIASTLPIVFFELSSFQLEASVSSMVPVVLLDSNETSGLISSIDSVYNTKSLSPTYATGGISNLEPVVTPITYPLELITTGISSIDGVFISPPISGSYYSSGFIDTGYISPEMLSDTKVSTSILSPSNDKVISTVLSAGSVSDLTPIVKLDSVVSTVNIEPIGSSTTIGISSVSATVTTITPVVPIVKLSSSSLISDIGILGVQIQNDTILNSGYFYPGFIDWNYIKPDFTAGSAYISSVNTNIVIQLNSFELSTQISNLDYSNVVSIFKSYYQPGFVDWNYISPDITSNIDTAVSSLIPAVPLDSFLLTTEIGNVDIINESSERTLTNVFAFTEVGTFGTLTETSELQLTGELSTTDIGYINSDISVLLDSVVCYATVGSLDVINSSFAGADVVGIQSTSELGNLQSVLSDNTNPNQINANISSVSIQLSTDIQSSNLIGYSGSIGNSNVVSVSNVYSQSEIGDVGTSTETNIILGLSGISVQSYAGNISKLVDCSASGNQSQSDVGYVLSLHQTTTILATTSVGSVNSTFDHSISSLVVNTTLGNLTFGKLYSISGNESSISIGSLSNYSSLLLNSITNQSSIGALSKNIAIGLSGTQSLGYVNSLLESNSTQLSSNVVTTGLGVLGYTKSDSIRLSQVNSAVSFGLVSNNISISVSGITSYGLIQYQVPVEVIVPSGNVATVSQGQFTVSSSSTVNLTSVLGTTSIHSVDSVISRIATSYQLATNVGLLSNSSDVTNTGISSTIVQQPIFATHTVDSTGYQIQSDIGSIIKSFGVGLYVEPLVGYTGNLNKYSTTSISGSLSSINNGNVGTNLLASIYNPTLITSFGYLAHFIESDDIYYYGPIQFELINSTIIPFTVSLPIETGFDDTKEIETKFNTVFTSDTEFKNTKSFKGVCL